MLAVLGTPCPPFSTQRTKRFKVNSVREHAAYGTTFNSTLAFLETFNPVTAVLEQVAGFDMPESEADETTPLTRRACLVARACAGREIGRGRVESRF